MRKATWLCGLVLLSLVGADASAGTSPFSLHDMVAMQRISDPQLSPSGLGLVFGLRTTDLDANKGRTDLWSVTRRGLRQWTSHEAADFNPRWAHNASAIYFISTRSGSAQVWRLPVRMKGQFAHPESVD